MDDALLIMRHFALGLILMVALSVLGSATLAIYEVGETLVCIDKLFENRELGSMIEIYPSIYFEPITSRGQVKNNEYTLLVNEIAILTPGNIGTVGKPTRIMLSDAPFDLDSTFSFTPIPMKNVTVGRLQLINTTLYSGSWAEQTPYLVAFNEGNFSCCIYDQDTKQADMEDFLKRVDIIEKNNLSALLPLLWIE